MDLSIQVYLHCIHYNLTRIYIIAKTLSVLSHVIQIQLCTYDIMYVY